MIAGAAAASAGAAITLQSTETQTALVELYTSKDCSSCPPADAWLGRLTAKPGLWRDFVPVAFYVHYRDRLGWRDQLTDPRHADRQQTYARAWGSASVYTPALVLNGAEWHSWPTATEPRPDSRPAIGVLRATSTVERTWTIEFQPTRQASERFGLIAATHECGIVLPVKAGENAGRRLTHAFVVRQVRSRQRTRFTRPNWRCPQAR